MSMVKFQHDWITFTTLNTRVTQKVFPNILAHFLPKSSFSGLNIFKMFCFVPNVPFFRLSLTAVTASTLSNSKRLESPTKFLNILVLFAS